MMDEARNRRFAMIIGILAMLQAVADAAVGGYLLALPGRLAAQGFPMNSIVEMPEFADPLSAATRLFFTLSALFLLGGMLDITRKRGGSTVIIIASVLQIFGLVFIAIFLNAKVLPLLNEFFAAFGSPAHAWLYKTPGLILFTGIATLLPEALIALSLLSIRRRP